MQSIPPSLRKALCDTILNCSPLEEISLRSLFISDEHLSLWERYLPGLEGLDYLARTEALIDFLVNRANRANENGLVLFLRAVRDDTHTEDGCYARLDSLANQVEATLHEQVGSGRYAEKARPDEKSMLLEDVQVTLRKNKEGWFLQAKNVSLRPLRKVTIFLHPGQALWVNKHKLSLGVMLPTAVSTPWPLTFSIKQLQSIIDREAYQLGIEVVYLPQPGSQTVRLQKLLDFLV